ncbi:MAG: hypothetical protein LIO51_00405, partial [Clostridiales bacterium]|nr:hypothetical protein [Clostridiales bacterium]
PSADPPRAEPDAPAGPGPPPHALPLDRAGGDFDGEMPEGGGDFDGEMPEGGDFDGEMPDGKGGGMSGGFGGSGFTAGDETLTLDLTDVTITLSDGSEGSVSDLAVDDIL